MKNLLLLIIILTSINIYPQNWLKVDSIFSVSGVTVKSFSAPEFADLNNDGNPDLIIGNLDDKADFSGTILTTFPQLFGKILLSFQMFIKMGKQTQTQLIQHLLI